VSRYFAPLVAFAVAAAFAAHAQLLPEFLVQVRDPNLLGGVIFQWALAHLGYGFVVGICAALAAGAVLLTAWRTRLRGAPDVYCALAAVLAAVCLTGRYGVSLDPAGWLCAAAFAVFAERHGKPALVSALAVVTLWTFVQGGATLAALIAVALFAGSWLDGRRFDEPVKEKGLLALACVLLGTLQLSDAPWHAYGAHALYLDAFLPGAQRDRLWNGGFDFNTIAFSAVVIAAAWYGVRRREHSGDALVFFALMLLALADARNLPYFGLVAAPAVADAVASYYLGARSLPRGSLFGYAAAFLACAFAFIAAIVVTQPKVFLWPQTAEQPVKLLSALAADRQQHVVLCQQPRWCDGVQDAFPNLHPLLDDRGGLAAERSLKVQRDAAKTSGSWRSELRVSHVDAVIANADTSVASLLEEAGWNVEGKAGPRVLLERAQ
jgi:hypothetical protein